MKHRTLQKIAKENLVQSGGNPAQPPICNLYFIIKWMQNRKWRTQQMTSGPGHLSPVLL